jgi:4-hydroxy-3-polyprenylbenzoate decarboxylase
MHVGSKLIIDASGDVVHEAPPALRDEPTRFNPLVVRWKLLDGGFLVVVVRRDARGVLETLIEASLGVRFIVAVSDDVDLDDEENLQWGIFTRFDPARDMLFENQKFVGARPVYGGTVGIDATWKEGYPAPLETDDSTRRLVDRRWNSYF